MDKYIVTGYMDLRRLCRICITLFPLSAYAGDGTVVLTLPKAPLHMPDLVLSGRLGRTLSFSKCELISGLTCSVSLRTGQRLPSRVYFVEIDKKGKALSKRIRLIYPNLKPGESGRATFRITGDANQLVLRGEWQGAWQDPY